MISEGPYAMFIQHKGAQTRLFLGHPFDRNVEGVNSDFGLPLFPVWLEVGVKRYITF